MVGQAVTGPLIPTHLTDLTFIIGPDDKKRSLPVISNMLRASSSAFDRMFSGPWAESDKKEIRLPDDDPDAFNLLLEILHHKKKAFSDPPQPVQLLALTVLCHKYDFIALVRDCFIR
jgi:hypothetical protein